MRKFLVLLSFFFSLFCFSQRDFVQGYYVDNNNTKHNGFIDYVNSFNSPTKIAYKNQLDKETIILPIEEIKEFELLNIYKYQRYEVEVDKEIVDGFDISSRNKELVISKIQVLLKLLVQGNHSLYSAIINDEEFFYIKSTKDSTPQLLFYKKYKKNELVSENAPFRKQLYDLYLTKNSSIEIKDFLELEYDEKSLIELFEKLNLEDKSLIKNTFVKNHDRFNFYLLGGISSMSGEYFSSIKVAPTEINGFSLGAEIGLVPNQNMSRNEFFARLIFQNFSYNGAVINSLPTIFLPGKAFKVSHNLSTIDFVIGYRRSLFKKGMNNLFIEGYTGFSQAVNNNLFFERENTFLIGGTNPNIVETSTFISDRSVSIVKFGTGIGYNYGRFGFSIDYLFSTIYTLAEFEINNTGFNLLLRYNLN